MVIPLLELDVVVWITLVVDVETELSVVEELGVGEELMGDDVEEAIIVVVVLSGDTVIMGPLLFVMCIVLVPTQPAVTTIKRAKAITTKPFPSMFYTHSQ